MYVRGPFHSAGSFTDCVIDLGFIVLIRKETNQYTSTFDIALLQWKRRIFISRGYTFEGSWSGDSLSVIFSQGEDSLNGEFRWFWSSVNECWESCRERNFISGPNWLLGFLITFDFVFWDSFRFSDLSWWSLQDDDGFFGMTCSS